MNVANLELCKELYGLSGGVLLSEWGSTYFYYTLSGNVASGWYINPNGGTNGKDDIPAYDLGCLLRKLPKTVDRSYRNGRNGSKGTSIRSQKLALYPQFNYWICNYVGVYGADGDTPEDAAAKLAIELFKSGVLSHDNQ